MKNVRYCQDGFSVNGGRWQFWWEKYNKFEDFEYARDTKIAG